MGVHTIVLRLGRVPFMDATGLQTLAEVVERFGKRQVRVLLCGVHPDLMDSLQRAGVLDLLGADALCASMTEVAARVARPLRYFAINRFSGSLTACAQIS